METLNAKTITVEALVSAPVEKVWNYWNQPEHITKWNQASEDWHAPFAENDLRPGGKLVCRMEAKDGSFGFDFSATYDSVAEHELIEYTIGDGRKVQVKFISEGQTTRVIESFEMEDTHSAELQKNGWHAILDSFKRYTESN